MFEFSRFAAQQELTEHLVLRTPTPTTRAAAACRSHTQRIASAFAQNQRAAVAHLARSSPRTTMPACSHARGCWRAAAPRVSWLALIARSLLTTAQAKQARAMGAWGVERMSWREGFVRRSCCKLGNVVIRRRGGRGCAVEAGNTYICGTEMQWGCETVTAVRGPKRRPDS